MEVSTTLRNSATEMGGYTHTHTHTVLSYYLWSSLLANSTTAFVFADIKRERTKFQVFNFCSFFVVVVVVVTERFIL